MATNYTYSAPADNTEIKYDRITKDFAIYVDGKIIGYAPNFHAAEQKRTQYLAERDFDNNACAGFGCVDGCGDCEPTCTCNGWGCRVCEANEVYDVR